MNELTIFENEEFGKVRVVEINNEPWFVGRDVAKALGYSNTKDAIIKRVDVEDKMNGVAICDPIGREHKPVLINESGLYSLILTSKLESAKKFKHWVTSEVLPSIRKHGAYMTDVTIERLADNPDLLIELCNKLKAERQKNEELKKENTIQSQKLLEYEPKATYYDLVLQSKGTVSITVIAKDFGMTAQELNKILCDKKIQRKVSGVYVLNKKYADKGIQSLKHLLKMVCLA